MQIWYFNFFKSGKKLRVRKYLIAALGIIPLFCTGCKRTDSLFPIVDEPLPSIIQKDEPSKDSTAVTSPVLNTNWGDAIVLPKIPARSFAIADFGAVTNAEDNAASIQKAIDSAAKVGGGMVVVPAGTYNCGPLKLKSNVGLQISEGAILKVLPYEAYPGAGSTASVASFIDLTGTTNVWVGGQGMIDGQGAAWWTAYRATKPTGGIARPAMIAFDKADTVEVAGITIQNAPNGHISVHRGNKNVTISGVTLSSPEDSPNTDGIDVWSPYVNILNCNISCGDDNIAMNNDTKYVTIADCTFGKGHGLSIGSYTSNIDHIYVHNCVFNGTDNGVHIKSSRGRSGIVEYLVYENLTMTDVSTPINICEYYPDNTIPSSATADHSEAVTTSTPVWRRIVFKDFLVTDAQNAGLLWAVPEMHMKALIFDNVHISAKTGMKANYIDSMAFINGSKIAVTSGKAFVSTYSSSISGIDLSTGAPE